MSRVTRVVAMAILAIACGAVTSQAAPDVVTLTDAQLMDLGDLGWGSGSLGGKTDVLDEGVEFDITLGSEEDGKLAVGVWNSFSADWSGYDGFALKFTLLEGPEGTVEVANFLQESSTWDFRQTKEDWPELSVGESAVVYIDFADCIDGPGNAKDITGAVNPVRGVGFQVITYDPDMLGEGITLSVEPTNVPEPATLGLLALAGLVGVVRRRR